MTAHSLKQCGARRHIDLNLMGIFAKFHVARPSGRSANET
ncbi:hypothetical protein Z950_2779 [Sulfitobacter mediterraneus KCTC 32188]|nr:hypothetical protein Z950_2779 [Sulfitobacter mediterraneus KCTC 32188]